MAQDWLQAQAWDRDRGYQHCFVGWIGQSLSGFIIVAIVLLFLNFLFKYIMEYSVKICIHTSVLASLSLVTSHDPLRCTLQFRIFESMCASFSRGSENMQRHLRNALYWNLFNQKKKKVSKQGIYAINIFCLFYIMDY